jgi:hypothetical protein
MPGFFDNKVKGIQVFGRESFDFRDQNIYIIKRKSVRFARRFQKGCHRQQRPSKEDGQHAGLAARSEQFFFL